MIRLRRFASYTVLVIACVASLATSQPYGVSRQTDGQTTATGESPVIEGSIVIPRNPVSSEALDISITVQGRGLGFDSPSASLEGRVATGSDELGPWLAMPVTAQLSSSTVCDTSGPCDIPFRFQLRPAFAQRNADVVLPWHIDAFVAGTDTADLQVSTGDSGPSATALAFLGGIVGLVAGLIAVFLVLKFAGGRRRLAVTAVAIAAGVFALLFLTEGVFVDGLPPTVSMASASAFLALPFALITGSRRGAQGDVLAVGLLGTPVLLGLTNNAGVFRVIDVLALFGALGVLIPVGAALLLLTQQQPVQPAASRPRDWKAALILALFLVALIYGWALVVAGGGTRYPLFYVGIPVISVGLLAWGSWCWWDASSGTLLAATGILLPVFAILGFPAAVLPYMFSGYVLPFAVFPSLLIILICGVALSVLTLRRTKQNQRLDEVA